jgi:poly-gamma-glutamate synthesis protein (capsule biosynthesis protein)
MDIKGVRIGSLAYQGWRDKKEEVMQKLPSQIEELRSKGCEIVVVSFHWGNEKEYSPTETQIALGRFAVDSGADLVVGHHSHRINPIELYKGKYICYSLGNFSFAGHSNPDDKSTYIFQIRFRVKDGIANGEAIRLIPCRISSRTDYNDFAPTPYDDEATIETVINLLKKYGKNLEYALEEYPTKWPDEE